MLLIITLKQSSLEMDHVPPFAPAPIQWKWPPDALQILEHGFHAQGCTFCVVDHRGALLQAHGGTDAGVHKCCADVEVPSEPFRNCAAGKWDDAIQPYGLGRATESKPTVPIW